MGIDDELEKLHLLNLQREQINERMLQLHDEICTNHCPVKLYDQVIVNGYSNTGKTMIVDHIEIKQSFDCLKFLLKGYVLRKDNTVGQNRGEHVIDIETSTKFKIW